jgi:hypothetical protein
MTLLRKAHRLSPYEECAGPIKRLFDEDGALIALVGNTHLCLPIEMKHDLQHLMGQRITILRTDIPRKPYLFRVLTQELDYEEKTEQEG